jgi:hypothetical protein
MTYDPTAAPQVYCVASFADDLDREIGRMLDAVGVASDFKGERSTVACSYTNFAAARSVRLGCSWIYVLEGLHASLPKVQRRTCFLLSHNLSERNESQHRRHIALETHTFAPRSL